MSSAAMNIEDELLYSAKDGIGHIVLNRPHRRNAMTFGMYDRIKEICARAEEMARGITELAPLTLDATMRGLQRLRETVPLPNDHDLVEQCFGSADFKEGLSAFFEKRKPDWKGA